MWGARRLDLRAEHGQAMIETALSSLLLMLLLLGAVELGMVAYAAIEVANSAKAAAQYAAMNGGAWTRTGLDTTGMLNAAQADAGNMVSNISFTTAPGYTCSCTGGGAANCASSPPTGCVGSHLLVTITVQTQANYRPLIQIPGSRFTTITLYGSAQEEVLQ
ncbi:MAG TPA: TadE/TadG family type IV pilus assembly protein [Terracidiphilus sp.]|nr:TadE/TadG family type IV pilus assembly protein [Terracidiphilus sp.]